MSRALYLYSLGSYDGLIPDLFKELSLETVAAHNGMEAIDAIDRGGLTAIVMEIKIALGTGIMGSTNPNYQPLQEIARTGDHVRYDECAYAVIRHARKSASLEMLPILIYTVVERSGEMIAPNSERDALAAGANRYIPMDHNPGKGYDELRFQLKQAILKK